MCVHPYVRRVVLPHSDSAVNLSLAGGTDHYINASLIPSEHKSVPSYIATQGPLENTVDDFWKMIVEKKTSIVVMVTQLTSTNGAVLCHQYWPENEATYGDATVSLIKSTEHPNYIVREFKVTVQAEPKVIDPEFASASMTVTHYQYLGFPETATPEDATTFLAFRRDVQALQNGLADDAKAAPMVVHCDRGCGRTGVFICLNSELERYFATGEVDLFDAVAAVRRKRAQSVETKGQYVFLHRAFLTELLNGPNRINGTHSDEFQEYYAQFLIDPETTTFDLGREGRKGTNLCSGFLLKEKNEEPKAVSLALMNDVVIMAAVADDGKHMMMDYKSRDAIASKEHVKGGANSIKLTLNNAYILDAPDASTKTEWLDLLSSMDGFKSTSAMTGERVISPRIFGRPQILNQMGCSDPQTFDGSTTLKSEFSLIPLVFNSQQGTGDARVETAIGMDRAVSNPMYRQQAPPNESYASPLPSPQHSPIARSMLGNNRFQFAGLQGKAFGIWHLAFGTLACC